MFWGSFENGERLSPETSGFGLSMVVGTQMAAGIANSRFLERGVFFWASQDIAEQK